MTTPTRTAVIYARFSTDMQKDTSIDDQVADCRRYADRQGLKVIKVYSDRARTSATLFDREGAIDLMRAAKQKAFDVVIVENVDRLSRDLEDLPGLYKRLTFHGIELHTLNDGIADKMKIGFRGMAGAIFLENLGRNVRRGQGGLVRAGLVPGAIAYGYRRVAHQPKGTVEIDPAKAEVVRRIFREYASGRSPRAIASSLNDEGVPSPSGTAPWNHQTFVGGRLKRGMISNQIYIGELLWNESRSVLNPDTGKRLKRAAPDEDRITKPMPHLRIIDQPLWNAAQALRKKRAIQKFGPEGKVTRRPVLARNEHMLAGILQCGACHGHMRINNVSRDGGSRVACAAAHQHSTCQHTKSYDLNRLQTAIIVGMHERLTDPALLNEMAQSYRVQKTKLRRTKLTERSDAAKRLARIEVQSDRLADAIANSEGFDRTLTAKLKSLEIERAGLEEQIRLMDAETNVVDLHPRAIDEFCKNVRFLHDAFQRNALTDENRAAFRNLIETIVVHPTGKRMPYEFTPYSRLGAILGIDLFPATRQPAEILAAQGDFACSDTGNAGKAGLTVSQQGDRVVSLGHWRERAAA